MNRKADFLLNESIRIDSHNESNRIDSNRELECSSQWVIFHVRVIILTRCETRVFRFSKKAQNKDIKIYIFVKIRPTVIEILTFNRGA